MARNVWLLGVLAVVLLHGAVRADTVVIEPSRDTTIYGESGALSNGAGSEMFAGVTDNGAERRALVAFDIAGALPAGSTITSVSLTLRTATGDGGAGCCSANGQANAGLWLLVFLVLVRRRRPTRQVTG